jgi:16S rRNA (cytosine1402-N4)-methyltransferase
MSAYHRPAMLQEALEGLNLAPGRCVLDATLGGGGHSVEIAQRIAPGGMLIGLDQDDDALEAAGAVLEAKAPADVTVRLVRSNFAAMRPALADAGVTAVDAVLMDLGVSSHQLDTAQRGFAFRYNGPLDMRMSRTVGETAAEMLNRLPEAEIARLLFEYGEESRSRRIAEEIVRRRRERPLATTEDLVDAVRGAMPFRTRPGEIHPATKTFQAVRIAVNRELEVLEEGLRAAVSLLAPGGRIVVIAYHSLEDRIVKNVFGELSGKRIGTDFPEVVEFDAPSLAILTRKPLAPAAAEIRDNPRSRSAKMRIAERLGAVHSEQ